QTIVKGLAQKKQVQLIIVEDSSQQSLPPITADQRMFKQIMYNLLSNAIKFTPEGGSVRVSTKLILDPPPTSGSTGRVPMIELSIADTGIGIKEEDCLRVFEEFVQLDHSYSRKEEGTGLGLA